MFKRIESILNYLGLTHLSYLKNFEDNAMDDETVAMCFQNENDLAALKEVIPVTGHRMRFIRAFREQLAETSREILGPNESSVSQGIDLSAGSRGSVWRGQEHGTMVLGAPYKPSDDKLASGFSFGSESSGQRSDDNSAKDCLLHQPGKIGANSTTGNNNSELANPVCASEFGGEQHTCSSSMVTTGNNEGSDASMNRVDTFKNFGTELEESLISALSGARPVQIMNFEDRNTVHKAVFLEDEFRLVIEKCDPSRPVAVLAVAGEANTGKSLFISFVLRYLKGLWENNADWIGWNDTTVKPLQDVRWANGNEVVTKGIWVWSEPTTCKNSKGQEFDVLLMDTQGVCDEKTGERERAILAGMGLLTSSIMVLNTRNGIQEDTLKSLHNFLSLGLLALDRDENSVNAKQFRNLVFLVQDWENHEEFQFGNDGGRKFIERKLEEKDDHDDAHRKLRREMKNCFENIDCFLFPSPGLATSESRFTGSVVNATPEYRTFAKQMQLCIEQLVNPDNFPFKTRSGTVLAASDVLVMFQSCVNILNSETVSLSNGLCHLTADCYNLVIVGKCVNALIKNIESSLECVPFLTEEDFNRIQETAQEASLTMFKKSRKMGESAVIAATEADLMTKLDEKISHYRSTNQTKLNEARQHYETKVREILAEYETEMDSKLRDDVLYEDKFDAIHKQVANAARKKFEDLQCPPSLEPEVLPVLTGNTQNTDKWTHLVKLNKKRAEQSLQATVAEAEREYRNALDSSKFFEVEDLESADAEARSAALRVLKTFPQKLRQSTVNKAENELTTQLDAVYKKVWEQVEKKFKAEQMNLELVIEDGAQQYKKSMKSLLSPSTTTEPQNDSLPTDLPVPTADFDNFHHRSESAALERLAEFFEVNSGKFKNAVDVELKSEEQLRGRIAQAYADLKRRNELKSKSFKAQVVIYLSDAQQEFTDEMKRLAQRFDDEASLKTNAFKLKSSVKSKFEHNVEKSVLDIATWNEHLSRLDSHMDGLIDQHVRIIQLRLKEDEAAVQCAMSDARRVYSDQMRTVRESKSWYPPAEFKSVNDKILQETVQKITKDAKLTPAQAEQLQLSLQGVYSKFEEENHSCIPKYSHAIGIDLGTTYSCVGVYVNGKVEIIQENEKFTIPSCVYYGDGETRAVGEAASDGAFRSPEDLILDAKRLMGRKWSEKVVQDDIKQWYFNVVPVNGQPRIKCKAGVLRPEEVSAEVLAHLKSLAERHLGQQVASAVVTVPAYFNEGQRQATKDAATMAGLSARILTEPVAAAIAYRMDRAGDLNKNILVFDLGGGTFDVAVLTISGRDVNVKTINGDTHLGGEDFDKAIVKHVIEKVKAKTGRDLLQGKNSSNVDSRRKVNNLLRRLKLECERKKRDLSSVQMVHIRLEEAGWNLDETMMRSEFENLINGDLQKCMAIVKTALGDAKMSKSDIDDVVLVGGSTKIPKVQQLLKDYFNGIQLKHTVNPDQAVAYGAAIQAAIKVNTTQGNGLQNKILIQDCTPSSVGIETSSGSFAVLIPKGSKIPFSRKQTWYPVYDYQSGCSYPIYEGEIPIAKENNFLGKFVLNLPSVRKEEAKMETTTMIDDEGILSVKAVCLMDGNENDIIIDAYTGKMSKEEIEARRVDIAQRRT